MGSIVVYGTVCEFIPAVEAFEFALTTGRTAPFKNLRIDPIHEHDQYECKEEEKTENFLFRFTNIPAKRGEVNAVVVRAEDQHGRKIGRIYSADRLLEKAAEHSAGYRAYLLDLQAYEYAKSEGKVGTDPNGREFFFKIVGGATEDKYFEQNVAYFEAEEKAGRLKKDGKGEYAEKTITKKDQTTFEKKIYRAEIENPGGEMKRIWRDEIKNPYDGPDRPEMLRKAAGKSFCGPFVKVRNSVAAMEDLRQKPANVKDALDGALDAAFRQFGDTVPAEFTEGEKEPEPEAEPSPAATPSATTNGKEEEKPGQQSGDPKF
jgi:hypothetical protein